MDKQKQSSFSLNFFHSSVFDTEMCLVYVFEIWKSHLKRQPRTDRDSMKVSPPETFIKHHLQILGLKPCEHTTGTTFGFAG